MDTKRLIQGLKEYSDGLNDHRKILQINFHNLQTRWHSLRQCYQGDGADILHEKWEKTRARFNDFFDRTLHIVSFLEERIESLIFYDKAESLARLMKSVSTSMNLSSEAGFTKTSNSIAAGAFVIFNSYLSHLGGKHGKQYRKGREKFLGNLINDSKQPKWIRGMMKTKLLQNRSYMRGIPGYDVGHRFPGIDVPDNYRIEMVSMNRGRGNIAKKLGISDKFR